MTSELRNRISEIYIDYQTEKNLLISIVSFGFKHGILLDGDIDYDVPFIPNPFYGEELRPYNGTQKIISDYVFSHKEAAGFVGKFLDLLNFTLPYYEREGKKNLVVEIGCTGGMHRSVAISEEIGRILKDQGKEVFISHRDRRFWNG